MAWDGDGMATIGTDASRKRRAFPALLAVTRSYEVMFTKPLAFARVSVVWATVGYLSVIGFSMSRVQEGTPSVMATSAIVASLLTMLVLTVMSVAVANSWQRVVLTERWADAPVFGSAGLLRYSGAAAALILGFVLVPSLLITAVGMSLALSASAPAEAVSYVPLLALILLVFPSMIAARLSLALPAASVGDRLSLKDSWRATRGSGWRFLGGALLVVVPVFVAGRLFLSLARGLLGLVSGEASFVHAALVIASWLFMVGLGATYLALAYRFFVQGRDRLDDGTLEALKEQFS